MRKIPRMLTALLLAIIMLVSSVTPALAVATGKLTTYNTTHYVDILKYYFESVGDDVSISKIPQISLWLEFGASKQTQISLMSMGFTRTAAVELSDLMVEEDFDRTQCLSWLRNNNVQALDLPNSIVREIDVVLELMA